MHQRAARFGRQSSRVCGSRLGAVVNGSFAERTLRGDFVVSHYYKVTPHTRLLG